MATAAVSSAISYARENQKRFLDELKDLLRIPSVSTAEEHKDDVRKAAEVVANDLKRIGFENVEIIPTKGHPLVYADWLHAAGKPTALCYAHYDVQPAEPLDEWHTPPFEPTERNQNIYARGAVDDKGQLWMQLKAFESLFKAGNGTLPINVRVLIEGEEEVGGESIEEYVLKNANTGKLKADFALVTDTELFAPDMPTLCVGLRGLVYTEIEAQGAKTDLHSGVYGGAAPNPLFALVEIISKLKDADGKILIPGFYDDVQKPTDAELKAWASLPFDEEEYRKTEVGSTVLTGEPGYSVLYRTWARPTLEVHGMPGGFVAPGAKTVIPAPRVGESFHASGAQPEPGRHPEEVHRLREEAHAQGHSDQHQGAQQGPGVCRQHRQQVRACVGGSHARGLRQRHRVHPLGRLDSHRHPVRQGPENPQHHDGHGPARRQPARAQREVPHPELLSRDRVNHPVLPDTGRWEVGRPVACHQEVEASSMGRKPAALLVVGHL